ncbi:MAG: MerR family DNA-binding transcriptional regulator [Rhodobacteraceae bacterium]|nr:MerR family DNA-binding transcriptional regulator [Paracoccaceae bacterium]MCP5342941.1 MerR family DNA-binding transcriptional regulator [Paracoccaceae bacterium]
MSEELMTIRAMCDTFDVTPRTLRFYEAKELLSPIREGQKRLFTRRDRGRLKLILRGKRFGFTLEDIRQLLSLYDLGDQQQTQLKRTLEIARQRLDAMRQQRADLDSAIGELDEQIIAGQQLLTEKMRQSAA